VLRGAASRMQTQRYACRIVTDSVDLVMQAGDRRFSVSDQK